MGTWTFYLNKNEEEKINKLVAEGKYPSVYACVRHAVQDALTSNSVEEAKQKDYWWKHHKKE